MSRGDGAPHAQRAVQLRRERRRRGRDKGGEGEKHIAWLKPFWGSEGGDLGMDGFIEGSGIFVMFKKYFWDHYS